MFLDKGVSQVFKRLGYAKDDSEDSIEDVDKFLKKLNLTMSGNSRYILTFTTLFEFRVYFVVCTLK